MSDPSIVTTVLSMIAKAFFSALAGKTTEEIRRKIKGDPVQIVFKQALGKAIHRYGTTGSRLDLSRPLLQKDGPLTERIVAEELAKLVIFDQEPNVELIGQRWKASVSNPPKWRDFAFEAELLLKFLRAELRATKVFSPVFNAKSLDSIASNTVISNEVLVSVEAQLLALNEIMNARLGDLAHSFARASVSIRDQIHDFTLYIEEKTDGFVGRQFVFDALDNFIQKNKRGYFVVRGDPGIGKSSIAAYLVKTNGYAHHFNIRAEGINKASDFLKNICAQLISAYKLSYDVLPVEATQNAGFLVRLLDQISNKLGDDGKAIIVIDAIDEVDMSEEQPGVNPLCLPIIVPPNIFFIVTSRRIPFNMRIECEYSILDIEADSDGNIADIEEFIRYATVRPGIETYISTQKIRKLHFIEQLLQKSEGNFMYLHYVIPEIENGAYKNLGMKNIPQGLQNYYDDHWQRMRGQSYEDWFRYKLPVIVALTIVKEPVSIDLLAKFSDIHERSRIRWVLKEWSQFLHEEWIDVGGNMQKSYRVYHASFHDFIASKEEIIDERIDFRKAHAQIADQLWDELFTDQY